MDDSSFILLYKSDHIWNTQIPCKFPYKQVISKSLKNSKRATKPVINFQKMPYKDRLMHLKLPAFKYRQLGGDIIEVFKITHNIYDTEVSPNLRYY